MKDATRPETGEKRNRRTKRCAAVSGCGSGQLSVQPVTDVGKHFLLVRFHQQLVPGTGVQLAFNVLHTGVFQALDGAAHALALLAHRVGIAGEEEQRQNDRAVMDAYGFVKGTEARTSESACVAERMKLYQKLTETK